MKALPVDKQIAKIYPLPTHDLTTYGCLVYAQVTGIRFCFFVAGLSNVQPLNLAVSLLLTSCRCPI